jgi:hypothetical protein
MQASAANATNGAANRRNNFGRLKRENVGAKVVTTLMDIGLRPPEADERRLRRQSIPLSDESIEDISVIADLWNAHDQLNKTRRVGGDWKLPAVARRMLENQIASFWDQVGGRPATKEAREEFVRRSVAALKKHKK